MAIIKQQQQRGVEFSLADAKCKYMKINKPSTYVYPLTIKE